MTSRRTAKKSDPLCKKIPENPKYRHIKATIDTGASLSKYLDHLEDIRKNYRFRKDEIFKRLKVSTFVQLVIQVALSAEQEEEEGLLDTPTPQPTSNESPPSTARSSYSVVHGIGELDVSSDELCPSPPPSLPPSSPYLLLDVRDKDYYQQCHIIGAKSYPIAMLSRSCNYFTQDILSYMNKPGLIIILYDDNERIAPQAATVFVEKGVENIFLLSGGMKMLHKTFPRGIITGVVPSSCLHTPPLSSRRAHRAPVPPQPPAPPSLPHPLWPSPDNIAVLQEQLDTVLLASEPSSRASSRAAGGRRSVVTSSSRSGASRAGTSSSKYSSVPSPPTTSRGTTPWK